MNSSRWREAISTAPAAPWPKSSALPAPWRRRRSRCHPLERLVLTAMAYFQPVTRMAVADILGKPVSRDAIAALRSFGLIADRAAQSAARRALHLCDDAGVPRIVGIAEPARSARPRPARRGRVARQGAATAKSCVARSASSTMPKRKKWRKSKRTKNTGALGCSRNKREKKPPA